MKRIIAVALLLGILACIISTSFAVEPATTTSSKDTVYKLVDAVNSKNWNAYADLQTSNNKQGLQNFISNPENSKNHLGLFNIQSAKVKEIKALSLDFVSGFASIGKYKLKYPELNAYLVGIDYKVYNEDKYHFNGVNYSLFILAKESGVWRELEESDAPLESIVPAGLGFGSTEEKFALNVVMSRIKGIMVNQQVSAILNKSVKVTLNGDTVNFADSASNKQLYPLTYENRTYIPLRSAGGLLGSEINYDDTSNTVAISNKADLPEIKEIKFIDENGNTITAPNGWVHLSKKVKVKITLEKYVPTAEIYLYLTPTGTSTTKLQKLIDVIYPESSDTIEYNWDVSEGATGHFQIVVFNRNFARRSEYINITTGLPTK